MTEDFTIEPRVVPLGGLRGLEVHRTLPTRGLPTVGAWCFLDHFGPTYQAMEVLPHPHTGLQTVTWPLVGQIRHRDSLCNDVVLKPGELNLMTSGDGVSHSEFSVGETAAMTGLQFWVALPEDSRHGAANFEHLEDLPRVIRDSWQATVFVGEFAGERSPATVHSPLVGAELTLSAGRHEIPLDPAFEHALLAVDTTIDVDGHRIAKRDLRYLDIARSSVTVETPVVSTVVLLGGEPWRDPLVMWWNFIARNHDEIVAAREDWEAEAPRFGAVDGHSGQRIPAPPLPRVRLKPRTRRSR